MCLAPKKKRTSEPSRWKTKSFQVAGPGVDNSSPQPALYHCGWQEYKRYFRLNTPSLVREFARDATKTYQNYINTILYIANFAQTFSWSLADFNLPDLQKKVASHE